MSFFFLHFPWPYYHRMNGKGKLPASHKSEGLIGIMSDIVCLQIRNLVIEKSQHCQCLFTIIANDELSILLFFYVCFSSRVMYIHLRNLLSENFMIIFFFVTLFLFIVKFFIGNGEITVDCNQQVIRLRYLEISGC